MRLQKYLAYCGVSSRRKAEVLILSGRVSINNHRVTEMGITVNESDIIMLDGKIVSPVSAFTYILLYKPSGYITTVKDQFQRPSVIDLINLKDKRLYPVGRLDYDTSGLLILTDDGDFTYKLTHPSHEMPKTYEAIVIGKPTEDELEKMKKGLKIDNFITSPAKVELAAFHPNLKKNTNKLEDTSQKIIDKDNFNKYLLQIEIHEGHNRQVRKMCEAIGHPVTDLKRIKIGNLTLNGLKSGEFRYLTIEEIKELKDNFEFR